MIDDIVEQIAATLMVAAQQRAQTLDVLVQDAEEQETLIAVDAEQAESYTLDLPFYDDMSEHYSFDYRAQAYEMNVDATTVNYTVELTEEEIYEAAFAMVEHAHEQNDGGKQDTRCLIPLAERERSEIFKILHPIEWKNLYNTWHTGLNF